MFVPHDGDDFGVSEVNSCFNSREDAKKSTLSDHLVNYDSPVIGTIINSYLTTSFNRY